jgi:hypothetical protein
LETLQDGVTATFFKEPAVDSLLDALRRSDDLDTPPEDLARAAQRFSRDNFALELVAAVERALDAKTSRPPPVPALRS